MQEKQAIITLNYGYEINAWYKYMREVFIPSIRDYAKRINVDFILMNNNNSKYYNTWNQLQFMDYLDYYDRVMYIDGDCYVPKFNKLNFFEEVESDKIGVYKNIFAKISQCHSTFVSMVLNTNNTRYFTPPPSIYEQKTKWIESSKYICPLGRNMLNACYADEECFINECIYIQNIYDKLVYLTNLKSRGIDYQSRFLTTSMILDKKGHIYHFQLSSIFNKQVYQEVKFNELEKMIPKIIKRKNQ